MNLNCTFLQCFLHDNDGRRAIRLAKTAYQSLSPEEQHSLNEDLYGAGANEVQETPEFAETKLMELEKELGHLSGESKKYYNRAIALEQRALQQDGSEAYISSKKFRLQFLRADLFDARLAARRLTEYFHHKYELFGEEKLASKIQQVDLNNEEKEALVAGALTYTGASDSAGRPVIIARRTYLLYFSLTCIKRLWFYVFQKVMEGNEIAQKKGFIFFIYHMDMPFVNPTKARKIHPVLRMLRHGLPARIAAVHAYYTEMRELVILNLGLVLFARNERARFLTHFKRSHQECMLDAMTYGINPFQLPLTRNGDFQYEKICHFWEIQRQMEETSNNDVFR